MQDHDKTHTGGHRDRDHDGVPDNRDPVVRQPAADPGVTREIRKDAYERGRNDERSRHRRNPLLSIIIALLAVFGLAVLALYIYNGGSFTETGRDLDAATTRASEQVEESARELADETGEATQDLGRRVETVGEQRPAAEAAPPPAGEAPARR